MTERTGGSDVARTETLARHVRDSEYELFGYKYFTSSINRHESVRVRTTLNVRSACAFGLARVVDADGRAHAGSRGLSLFQVCHDACVCLILG
jgi:alkylation response protein AidB-like acyl-CoA dehydrogenase